MSLYDPIPIVTQTHELPHYDKQLQLTSNDFNANEDYIISITIFPLIIFIVTLVISIVYFIMLCCQPTQGKYINKHKTKGTYLYILPLLMIILAQIILVGILLMNEGIKETSNGLTFLSNQALNAANKLHSVTNEINSINNDFTNPSCSLYQNNALFLKGEAILSKYYNIIVDIADSIDKVSPQLNKINDNIVRIGITYKDIVFYFCYALILLYSIILLASICFRRKVGIRCLLSISMIYVIFLLIISAFQFISLIGIADFCVYPEANTLSFIKNKNAKQIAYHFMYCSGPLLPLIPSINSTSSNISNIIESFDENEQAYIRVPTISEIENVIINQVNTTIYNIENNINIATSCRTAFIQQNKNLAKSFSTIKTSSIEFFNIIECKPIQHIWLSEVVDGTCNKGFTGYYIIWIGIWIIIAFIMITIGILCGNLLWDDSAVEDTTIRTSSIHVLPPANEYEIELRTTTISAPSQIIISDEVDYADEYKQQYH